MVRYSAQQWTQFEKEYGAMDTLTTYKYDDHQSPEMVLQIDYFGPRGREKTARVVNYEDGKIKNTSLYFYYLIPDAVYDMPEETPAEIDAKDEAMAEAREDGLKKKALKSVDYLRGDTYYITGQAFYKNEMEGKELLDYVQEFMEV